MYRLGFTTVTFRKKSPEEICEIAKKNEIRYLEWGADVHATDTDTAKHIRSLCDSCGIETISLGSYYRIGDNDHASFRKNCEIAKILGAGRIRVWLGRKGSKEVTAEEREAFITETRSLSEIAAEYSLTLAFEFHKNTLTDSADEVCRFINDCKKENVKTYWQPFSYGHDTEELKKVLPYLDAVHVFSWDENNIRFPIDAKKADWLEFLNILEKNNSPADLIFEFVKDDDESIFERDVKLFRSWL